MTTSSTGGNEIQTHSTLTCPECGHATELEMPMDACLFFCECEACHVLIRPLPGDCCVFCSYGSAKCPPMQADQHCGFPCAGGT
ncbi:MAG: hypothetical protein HHJ16_08480 [Polaromonas sp.]|uniref:GDCCVxC domain-containing (seleno)protein n=1 Tax=Polaromonas sp. TaxID=1869339 RepID=UPI0017B07036|nr:GDCCVxC domain-containing (seleno)protein [Polaromonas sp.]NMM10294.1 hypothetical protein [Polaromonas sp.]